MNMNMPLPSNPGLNYVSHATSTPTPTPTPTPVQGRKRARSSPDEQIKDPHNDSGESEVVVLAVVKAAPKTLQPEDYSRDVLAYLRHREAILSRPNSPPPCYHRLNLSPDYPIRRRELVDWTCLVGERLELSPSSVHLAVRLLDLFMDVHKVEEPQLNLICLVTLLVASKMEEKETQVPHIGKLNALVQNRYQKKEYETVEICMMMYFRWNLNMPTAEHFIDLLFPYSLTPGSDFLSGQPIRPSDVERVRKAFYKFVRHFADSSLQDEALLDYPPSAVASAVIYCSRRAFELSPMWTRQLREVTGGHYPCDYYFAASAERLYRQYLIRLTEVTPPRPKRHSPASVFETPPPSASSKPIKTQTVLIPIKKRPPSPIVAVYHNETSARSADGGYFSSESFGQDHHRS